MATQARVFQARAFLRYVIALFGIVEIDSRPFFYPECPVFLIRQIVAFVLLALWLPATQHCDLEAAGLLQAHTVHQDGSSCCDRDSLCTHDGCKLVETGSYKPVQDILKAPTPQLFTHVCLLCLQLALIETHIEPVKPVVAIDGQRNWVPNWSFVRRSAPLSRAPSVIV